MANKCPKCHSTMHAVGGMEECLNPDCIYFEVTLPPGAHASLTDAEVADYAARRSSHNVKRDAARRKPDERLFG